MKNSRPALALWLLATLAAPASAAPELCETAARRAAAEFGVPETVMQALALTETGRALGGRLRPWPWAANLDGQGHWFDSAEAALRFARVRLAEGRTSLDLGCFQINWRWHGAAFPGPEALLDPLANARYAARFLAALRAEFGSWDDAVGAYHSRSPALAARYRARFAERLAGLRAQDSQGAADRGPGGADPGAPLADRARDLGRDRNEGRGTPGSLPLVPRAAPVSDPGAAPVSALASLVALPGRHAAPFLPGLRP